MTLAAAVSAGLARWPWLLGPVFVTAGLAALIGAAVESHATYRVTRVLEVTEGAPAEAIFVCRSRDVLATAMEKADLRRLVPPEELAEHVTVRQAGDGLVHLTVERADRTEAEDLAAAIAEEASRRVEVIARKAQKGAEEKRREIERRLLQIRANRDARLAELDDLRRTHPEEIDEQGHPLGTAQRRLIAVRDALAGARRTLAAAGAGLDALRASVGETPALTDPAGPPDAASGRGRLRRLDGEIERLRRDLTDRHPRLAELLAERARLTAEVALRASPVPNPLREELEGKLCEAEARRSRAAAEVAKLEEEERDLAPRAEEAVALGSVVRNIDEKLRDAETQIEDARREIDRVKREAAADTTARAALIDLSDLTKSGSRPPQVVALRTDAPPGKLAALGAVLGLMLGVLLAALAEAMDPVVRTPEDVARVLDMPVLAAVPGETLSGTFRATHPPGRSGRRFLTPFSSPARSLAWMIWLAAFLLAAAALIVLVYPGWERLAATFSRGRQGDHAEAPHEIEEVLP